MAVKIDYARKVFMRNVLRVWKKQAQLKKRQIQHKMELASQKTFYQDLMRGLREAIEAGTLDDFVANYLARLAEGIS